MGLYDTYRPTVVGTVAGVRASKLFTRQPKANAWSAFLGSGLLNDPIRFGKFFGKIYISKSSEK